MPLILLLMTAIHGFYPEPMNGSHIWENCTQSESFVPESPSPPDHRLGYSMVWSGFLNDLNSCDRSAREFVGGYRRITTNNVLHHETRKKIFDLIRNNPGITLSRLAELSDCNESTLRYHIFRITKEKCITTFSQGKPYCFFENHGRFTVEDQEFLSTFSSGQSGRIMQVIQEYPGITRSELADKLGVASPTVTRSVQHLAREGYILLVKEGKFTRHFLSKDSLSLVQ